MCTIEPSGLAGRPTAISGSSTIPYEPGYPRAVCWSGACASCPLAGPGWLSRCCIGCDGIEHAAVVTLSGGHAKTSDECDGDVLVVLLLESPNC